MDLQKKDLQAMKVPDLKELARELGVKGFSTLKKKELVEHLHKFIQDGGNKPSGYKEIVQVTPEMIRRQFQEEMANIVIVSASESEEEEDESDGEDFVVGVFGQFPAEKVVFQGEDYLLTRDDGFLFTIPDERLVGIVIGDTLHTIESIIGGEEEEGKKRSVADKDRIKKKIDELTPEQIKLELRRYKIELERREQAKIEREERRQREEREKQEAIEARRQFILKERATERKERESMGGEDFDAPEEEVEDVMVTRFLYRGINFLIDEDEGMLYDIHEHEEVGKIDKVTGNIVLVENLEDDWDLYYRPAVEQQRENEGMGGEDFDAPESESKVMKTLETFPEFKKIMFTYTQLARNMEEERIEEQVVEFFTDDENIYNFAQAITPTQTKGGDKFYELDYEYDDRKILDAIRPIIDEIIGKRPNYARKLDIRGQINTLLKQKGIQGQV
jgi:hypothetical protein